MRAADGWVDERSELRDGALKICTSIFGIRVLSLVFLEYCRRSRNATPMVYFRCPEWDQGGHVVS